MLTLLSLLIPLILVAGGWCWLNGLLRLSRGLPLLEYEPRRPVPWDVLDLFFTLLIAVAAQTCALLLARKLVVLPDSTALEELDVGSRAALIMAGAVASLATMGLSAAAIFLRSGARWRDMGIVSRSVLTDMGLGLIAFVMLAPPVYIIQLILVQWFESKHPLIEMLRENPNPVFLVVSGFTAVVVAPVVEEYLFRLLMQGWMEKVAFFRGRQGWISTTDDYQRRWPSEEESTVIGTTPPTDDSPIQRPLMSENRDDHENPYQTPHPERSTVGIQGADGIQEADAFRDSSGLRETGPTVRRGRHAVLPILISSSIFALLHWSHGPDWVPLFFLALGLGYLYSRTHRIIPCITVHFLLNGMSMLALLSELWKETP